MLTEKFNLWSALNSKLHFDYLTNCVKCLIYFYNPTMTNCGSSICNKNTMTLLRKQLPHTLYIQL